MEFENDGVKAVEIAEPQEEALDISDTGVSGDDDIDDTDDVTEEVAVPQSAQANAQFAENRRKQEIEELRTRFSRADEEKATLAKELERLREQTQVALTPFVDGKDLNSMLFNAQAYAKGITPEQLKEINAKELQEQQKQIEIDEELNYYRKLEKDIMSKEAQKLIEEDLKAVQSLDSGIKSIDELGEEFARLRFTVNPLTGECYSVGEVYNHLKGKIRPLPPTSGAVNSEMEKQKETNYMKMSNDDFEKKYNKIVFGS